MAGTETSTRRVDGKPETAADKRFFDLRQSGYTGPINQDGYKPDMANPRDREMAGVLTRMRRGH
jgi:hypothetical protein